MSWSDPPPPMPRFEFVRRGSLMIEAAFAAWIFFAYGFLLLVFWVLAWQGLIDPTSIGLRSPNPIIRFTVRHGVPLGIWFVVLGGAHGWALWYWPRVTWTRIAIRKIGSGCAGIFWGAMFVNSVLLVPRQPSGFLTPIAAVPIVLVLAFAVFRWGYRDW